MNGGGSESDETGSQSRSGFNAGTTYSGSQSNSAWGAYEEDAVNDGEGPNVNAVYCAPSIRPQSSVAVFSDHELPSKGGVSVLGDPRDEGSANVMGGSEISDARHGQSGGKWLCSAHGILCKKGVCKEYTKEKKRIEREKRDKEREEAKASKDGKRRRKGRKNGAADASTSGGGRREKNGGSNVASDDDWEKGESQSKYPSDSDVFRSLCVLTVVVSTS